MSPSPLSSSSLLLLLLLLLQAMDDAIGALLAELDAMGTATDTVVVYTSDQGYFLGEHNGFDKRFMWDESLRVPAVVRYPREVAPGTLVGSGTLLSNVDWAPTLLDFAQVMPRYDPAP